MQAVIHFPFEVHNAAVVLFEREAAIRRARNQVKAKIKDAKHNQDLKDNKDLTDPKLKPLGAKCS